MSIELTQGSHLVARSADLRDQVRGKVLVAGDAGYEEARQGWNLTVVQTPLLVVEAEGVEDVRAALAFAREAGLPVAAMTTGHGMARGCDGGVLIRMNRMNAVSIQEETKRAKVQGGAQFKHVFEVAHPLGLAPLSGSAPHVGVVGYTMGGGYGLMMRKHGLGVDSVRSMQIVTIQGEVVTASREENPDLFWAVLGGGGTFGVVTEIELELVSQATVFGGATIYPAENVEALFAAYHAWAAELPAEVTSAIQIMNFPPIPLIPEPLRGRAVVNINACVCGDLANAAEIVRPIRELGPSVIDMWGEFPFAESGRIFNDPIDPLPAVGQGVLLRQANGETLRRLVAAVGPAERSPHLSVQFRPLGGQVAAGCRETTVTACHRDAEAILYFVGIPNPMVSKETLDAQAASIIKALGDDVLCHGPLTFVGEGQAPSDRVREVYHDEAYERLSTVKRNWDPENRFRFAGIGICLAEEV